MSLVQPTVRPLLETRTGHPVYVLESNYSFVWEEKDRSTEIVVPEGFAFDGASVPRLLWTPTGITPSGIYLGPAVVHDFLYSTKGRVEGYRKELTRKEADRIFLAMLRCAGANRLRARLAYWGVRLFGKSHWGDSK